VKSGVGVFGEGSSYCVLDGQCEGVCRVRVCALRFALRERQGVGEGERG
jgi:hypothetical protein